MKSIRFPVLAALALFVVVTQPVIAQQPQPIPVLKGSLMLAGYGTTPESALEAFVQLCGGFDVDVAVVSMRGKPRSAQRWRKLGVRRVVAIGKNSKNDPGLAVSMLGVSGVWFEDAATALQGDVLFEALLHNVLKLGGAVGGSGAGAVALASSTAGFAMLPRSKVHLLKAADLHGTCEEIDGLMVAADGLVGWQIPKETALVVHHGRRVCAFGSGAVVARVAAAESWSARRATIPGQDAYEYGRLAYEIDLLGWLRSAQDRTGPIFPAKKVAKPKLKRGTVVLSGGGGVQSPTWRRFIEAAGGKDAAIVCIPTSGNSSGAEVPSSYSAKGLRSHGCTNVSVLHTRDPRRADQGARFLSLLKKATGVWIDGGRTSNFMDAYEHTRVQEMIHEVVKRGGAVGGSSAGCQVIGEFLVRGDPRTNKRLVFDGYTRGLGVLPGVVCDAHFTARERAQPFSMLCQLYPQLLGIGVDGDTALVVEGSVAEVVGMKSVSFFDAAGSSDEPVVLRKGERYDLVKRRQVR